MKVSKKEEKKGKSTKFKEDYQLDFYPFLYQRSILLFIGLKLTHYYKTFKNFNIQ